MTVGDRLRVFVWGIGNPGRSDDGLGIELVRRVECEKPDVVRCEANYQLNIEDAYDIAGADVVVFVDASMKSNPPFEFTRILPSRNISFTTHSLDAESVLALCEEINGRSPVAFMLAIRGYEWDLREGLSIEASRGLERALSFIVRVIGESSVEAMERLQTTGNAGKRDVQH
ncbi:MAG TPA: hydrogenase maturation protease [Spirochaetota bacterium]|nr:hydrogenase maturation protease [Spirochaetota bacterium]